jgi:hypothetical protein
MSDYFHVEINPENVDRPIHVVPEVWDDEKPHELSSGWDEQRCWCVPLIDGQYVRHVSVFDAIEQRGALGDHQEER